MEKQTYICRRCGRKLISPESQQVGMGYFCYRKYQQEQKKRKLFKVSSIYK